MTIDGPGKVSLDCTETDNGYKARLDSLWLNIKLI